MLPKLYYLVYVSVLTYLEMCCGEEEKFQYVTKLGVLADKSYDGYLINKTMRTQQFVVELAWNFVDTKELYQILKVIKYMDDDKTLDGIVVFHLSLEESSLQLILATVQKPLIKWAGGYDELQKISEKNDSCSYQRDLYGGQENFLQKISFEGSSYLRYANVGNMTRCATKKAPHIATSLVKALHWEEIFILHENETERETRRIIDQLSDIGVMFRVLNLDRHSDVKELVHNAYDSEFMRRANVNVKFVLICRFECASNVLKKVNGMNINRMSIDMMIKQMSFWLVIVRGYLPGMEAVFADFADDLDNLAVVEVADINARFTTAESISNLETTVNTVMSEFGICVKKNEYGHSSFKEFAISALRNRSVLLHWTKFKIETLLWTENGRGFRTVGYATPSGEIEIFSHIFPNIRYGFNKKQFLVSTLEWAPLVFKEVSNGTITYKGFCLDLLKELSLLMNFTYKLTEPADGLWGSTYENGSWNGLVGQLERREVDLVAAPLTVHVGRAAVVDYTYPFFFDYTSIMIKQPNPDSKSWRKLLDPYHWKVVSVIIACLAMTGILLYIMERCNPFYERQANTYVDGDGNGPLTLIEVYMYMFGALCNEGSQFGLSSFSGRTLVSAWWIFSIIVIGIYTGNLIAFLTTNKEELPFKTLEELTELKDEFSWGTVGGAIWEQAFKTSHIPVFKKIWGGIVEFNRTNPRVLSNVFDVQFDQVRKGAYAFISAKTSMDEELTKPGACNLRQIEGDFLPQTYAIALPKHSPLTSIFSTNIINVEESGLFKIWKQRWWPPTSVCKQTAGRESKPVRLLDVQSAFYAAGAGLALTLVCFGSELLLNFFKRRSLLPMVNGISTEEKTKEKNES